jgi:hypothetical protein
MQLTDNQTIVQAWNELQSMPSYVERYARQKSLVEKYHQRFLECEAQCKSGEGDYSVFWQTWKALESDDPVAALNRWIERTQERINYFKQEQVEGRIKLTDKRGRVIRTCGPDENPFTAYFDRKLEIFEQALKEFAEVSDVLH